MASRSGPIVMVAYTYYPWDPRVSREAETLAHMGREVHVVCARDEGESPTAVENGVAGDRRPPGGPPGGSGGLRDPVRVVLRPRRARAPAHPPPARFGGDPRPLAPRLHRVSGPRSASSGRPPDP